jgi:hypothetical protein
MDFGTPTSKEEGCNHLPYTAPPSPNTDVLLVDTAVLLVHTAVLLVHTVVLLVHTVMLLVHTVMLVHIAQLVGSCIAMQEHIATLVEHKLLLAEEHKLLLAEEHKLGPAEERKLGPVGEHMLVLAEERKLGLAEEHTVSVAGIANPAVVRTPLVLVLELVEAALPSLGTLLQRHS